MLVAVLRILSVVGWFVVALSAGHGIARAQACQSLDHKITINNPCHKTDTAAFNQTGRTVQWDWQDGEDAATTTFSCSFSGIVTSCSVSPTSSFAGSGTVTVTYNTGSSGTGGSVNIRVTDSTFVNGSLTLDAPVTVSTAFTNATDQSLIRCAQSCFAAVVGISTPPYYSLDQPRNVTLMYNGDRVRARPFIYADVGSSGPTRPNNYQMQVTTSAGAKLRFTNGDSILTFDSSATTGRLGGQLALDSTIATGPLAVTVTVSANYSGVTQSRSTHFVLAAVNEHNSPIAHGWTVRGVQHLYAQSSDSALLITEGDGSAEVWSLCTTGGCAIPPIGEYSTLTYSGAFPASSYLRTYPDSTKVLFNSTGQMIRITDSFGNNDSLAYDASGRVSKIYDPIRTAGGSGRSYISLTYGATYGLTSIISPGADGTLTGGRTTTFSVSSSDSTLSAVTDPDGLAAHFGYDSRKRLSWEQNRRGDTTKFGYDDRSFKLTSVITPPIPRDNGDGTTSLYPDTTKYAPWQIVGIDTLPTSTASPAPLGSLSPQGSVTDPAHHTTSFTVNRWGEALVVTNALGATTTVAIADSNPVPLQYTTRSGGVAHYTWTGSHLTSYRLPGRGTKTMLYNSGYSVADSIFAPGQPAQRLFIGTGGRLDSLRFASSTARTVRYLYDTRGRATQVTDIHGHVIKYHYDAVFGNGDSVQAPGNRVTQKQFDRFGRDSAVWQNGTPHRTVIYDVMNRPTQVTAASWEGPTLMTYDGLYVTHIQDPKGQVHKYDVDALGRSMRIYDLADTTYTSYRYNVDGLVTSTTNRRGQRTDYTYDVLHRMLLSVRSVSGTTVMADTFSYDTIGLRTVRSNGVARDSIFMNANGWTSKVVTHLNGVHQRFQIQYFVDSLLRPDSMRVTDSTGVQLLPRYLTYDAVTGLPTSLALSTGSGLTTTFVANTEFNTVSTVLPGTGPNPKPGPLQDSLTSIHNPFQRQFSNSSVLDNAMNQKFGYDSLGRLNTSIPVNVALNQWAVSQYTYDGLGRLGLFRTQNTATLCPADTTSGYQCGVEPTVDSLTYDAVDNLVGGTMGGAAVFGKYATGNRDSSLRGVPHTFDADGNVITNGSRHFYWGVEGHLDSVAAGTDTLRYLYDAAGRMVMRYRKGVRERVYLWSGDQLLAEFDSSGAKRTGEYVSLGTDAPFAFIAGSTSLQSVSYFVRDAMGNTIGVVRSDSNGTQSVREQYTYDEFGKPTTVTDSGLANRLLWKGMFYEGDSTRLYYVRARWYDPQQGRFMSEDPLGVAAGRNQYAFAGGDPVNGHDPTGEDGTPCMERFDGGQDQCGGGSIPWGLNSGLPPDVLQNNNPYDRSGSGSASCDVQAIGAQACYAQAQALLSGQAVQQTGAWSGDLQIFVLQYDPELDYHKDFFHNFPRANDYAIIIDNLDNGQKITPGYNLYQDPGFAHSASGSLYIGEYQIGGFWQNGNTIFYVTHRFFLPILKIPTWF